MVNKKRYHINPETGRPNQCSAQTPEGCKYAHGDVIPQHYASKEDARVGYENDKKNDGEFENALAGSSVKTNRKDEKIQYSENPRERLSQMLNRVKTLNDEWRDSYENVWDSRYRKYEKKSRFTTEETAANFNEIHDLRMAMGEIKRNLRGPIEPHVQNTPHMFGLESAQHDVLKKENDSGWIENSTSVFKSRHRFGEHFDQDFNELLARQYGNHPEDEEVKSWSDNESYEKRTEYDEMLYSLNNDQQVSAVMEFPEKYLEPVLDKLNVDNVSVSPFNNGREFGLVYSVMNPEGSTRSFSLYEHRNTDSMIINGTENWNRNQSDYGPYSKDGKGNSSKNNFFAEFAYGTDKRQVAETLGYFLKSAQKGNLENDQELMSKAEHVDWGAILSNSVPGFKEWIEERNPDKPVTNKDDDGFSFFDKDGKPKF